MGCSPCGSPADEPHPIKPLQTHKKLTNFIHLYRKTPQDLLHPALSLQECTQLQNFMASNNTLAHFAPDPQDSGGQTALLSPLQKIIWKCFLIIPSYKPHDSKTHPNEYCREIEEREKNSFYQISLDVNRTFPLNSLDREALSNILRNLSSHYPGLGYTQGMNYFAGFLLLCGFSEQESFHLLVILFTSQEYFFAHNFHDSFKQTMTASKVLLDHVDPKLREHLELFEIFDQLYSFQWFLCCFLITLSPQVSVKIWDEMIKYGYEGVTWEESFSGMAFIINIGVEIMGFLKDELLLSQSAEEILNVLRSDTLKKRIDLDTIEKMNKNIEQKLNSSKHIRQVVRRRKLIEKDKVLEDVLFKKEIYIEYLDSLQKSAKRT